jgi:hypothetical protein
MGKDNNYIQIDGMSRHQHEHVSIVFKFKCIALQKVERALLYQGAISQVLT